VSATVVRFPTVSDGLVAGLMALAAQIEAGDIPAVAAVVVTLTKSGGVGCTVFGDSSIPAALGAMQIAALAIIDEAMDCDP
jgi:hypothetical protein